MRVRGSNSETDIVSESGKRRFASLRKPISPLQKYENIESSKLFTENLLREEELSLRLFFYLFFYLFICLFIFYCLFYYFLFFIF